MSFLDEFLKKYKVDTVELVIKQKRYTFFLPQDISDFINQDNPFDNFPLWARIWESAIVLADYLSGLSIENKKSFLEIGAGIGVVGTVVASFNHQVTITDCSEDALNFVRANVYKNLGPDVSNVEVKILDWRKPEISRNYDYIIGSDIVYKEEDFEPLIKLFDIALKKDGEIILAEGLRKNSLKFFDILSKKYKIKATKKVLRSDTEKVPIILARIKPILS